MNEFQIFDAISGVLGHRDRLVVIHSSLMNFRLPWKELKWPLIGAFRRLISQGRTLIVPAFTLSFCRGKPFHYLHSPSETGILADWLMQLTESRRNEHPIYSFVIAGPDRDRLLKQKGETTWDESSLFGLFDKENVRFVLFGAPFTVCTQVHYYEEEARVPYRFYKQFPGQADFGRGACEITATMYSRHIDSVGHGQFGVIEERMLTKGLIDSYHWQGGMIQAFNCESLASTAREMLQSDPYIFMGNQRVTARYAIESKKKRERAQPIRVALLGNHNLEFLKSALKTALEQVIRDQEIVLFTPPIAQLYAEITEDQSSLANFKPDFAFFTERLEDLFKVHSLTPGLDGDLEAINIYLDMIQQFASGFSGVVFVNRFLSAMAPTEAFADLANPHGIHALVKQANNLLDHSLESLKNVFKLDIGQIASLFHGGEVYDPRLWFLGRFPYSMPFSVALAEQSMGAILAMTGRTTRMLVLDLDNTLWGGVLGEDGPGGLALGGDYPGNAFLHFQKTIGQLMQRGIAVAVASKNDEDHALATINSLENMVLRQKHLATWRINWQEKWRNVLEMATEVGLGLENILFVDDNPAERLSMRMNLPEVKVVDLPADPARYAATLLSQPWLSCVQLTREDRGRANQYSAKRQIEHERKNFTNHEEFCATLEPELHIAPLGTDTMARAVQLVNKTNQFNTTTRRFTQVELEGMGQQNREVLVLGLKDRFSEFENIGLAIIHWGHPTADCLTIDLFLLSCRVLGRGVENGFMAWLADRATRNKIKKIHGLIIDSERNTIVRDLFEKHGFIFNSEEKIWELVLSRSDPKMPKWMTLIDKTGNGP